MTLTRQFLLKQLASIKSWTGQEWKIWHIIALNVMLDRLHYLYAVSIRYGYG